MSSLSYERIIASAPSRFLVGSNKRLFTVHAAVISHHSKSLGDLINGGTSEANEGCALLEDVEESTFIRFSQYAYTGNYIPADPEIPPDSSTIGGLDVWSAWGKPAPNTDNASPEAVAVEEPPSGFNTAPPPPPGPEAGPFFDMEEPEVIEEPPSGFNTAHSKKKKKKPKVWAEESDFGSEIFKRGDEQDKAFESASPSRKEKLWKLFERRKYTISTFSIFHRRNGGSCEDYTDVFLCHARLYVFADKWDIGPLKQLSLYKLHKTLCVFTLYKERVGDIVTLMRYSYDNTPHLSSTEDPLRSLLIHYATCVVETLVQSPEFKALLVLEEARELASDLIVKMIDRLD